MTKFEEICLMYFGEKISLDAAINEIKELPRSWHTKEWKEKRALALKSHCEICGTEDSLQIQHTKHPTKIGKLRTQIMSDLVRKEMKGHKITDEELYQFKSKFLKSVNGCSECLRKVSGGKCPNCKKSIPTGQKVNYFKVPGIKNHLEGERLEGPDKIKLYDLYIRSIIPKLKIDIWDKNKIQINDHVFKLSYLETIRYLSFVDTITACKRCAAKQDSVYISVNKLMKEWKSYR